MFDVNSFVSFNVLRKIRESSLSNSSYLVLVNLLILGRVHSVKFCKRISEAVDILSWYDNVFTPVLSGQAEPPEGLVESLYTSNKFFRQMASALGTDCKILLNGPYFSFLVGPDTLLDYNFDDFAKTFTSEVDHSKSEVINVVHQ